MAEIRIVHTCQVNAASMKLQSRHLPQVPRSDHLVRCCHYPLLCAPHGLALSILRQALYFPQRLSRDPKSASICMSHEESRMREYIDPPRNRSFSYSYHPKRMCFLLSEISAERLWTPRLFEK